MPSRTPTRLSLFFTLAACGPAGSLPGAGSDGPAGAGGGKESSCEVSVARDLSVSEGGRLEIPREGVFAEEAWQFEASEGLQLRVEAQSLVVYASYGSASEQSLTLSRSGCDDVAISVSLRPLRWSVLSRWDPAVAGPPAREYGAWWLADDGARDGVFVFGGFHYVPKQFTPASDLWFFDFESSTWAEVPTTGAPIVPGARVARGPDPGTVLLHGGSAPQEDGSLDTPASLQLLRYGDKSDSWSAAPDAEGSPGSYTGAFIHDSSRKRWLSICGADSRKLGVNCAVSEYTADGGWRRLPVAGDEPPARFGFHYGYDELTDRVLIVAGQSAGGAMLGDTWALELGGEGPRWQRIFDDLPEVRRRNGAFVLDPIGRRLIIWGGTADGATPVPGLSMLRLDRERERWDHLATPQDVPPRASAYAVYDKVRERAVMGFGNGAAVYADLYGLSL